MAGITSFRLEKQVPRGMRCMHGACKSPISSKRQTPTGSAMMATGMQYDGVGRGGWHDAWLCCCLQPPAPIGLSPLTLALSLNVLPPQAAAPTGLSPPCALPVPAWPIPTSIHTLPFLWEVCGGGGGWHKALVVGSVSLWRRLLASRL